MKLSNLGKLQSFGITLMTTSIINADIENPKYFKVCLHRTDISYRMKMIGLDPRNWMCKKFYSKFKVEIIYFVYLLFKHLHMVSIVCNNLIETTVCPIHLHYHYLTNQKPWPYHKHYKCISYCNKQPKQGP